MVRYLIKILEDHNKSGFFKKDLIKNYKFSFCPENSIYPGYVTEKIPEVYASKSIPITWIDQIFRMIFNLIVLLTYLMMPQIIMRTLTV